MSKNTDKKRKYSEISNDDFFNDLSSKILNDDDLENDEIPSEGTSSENKSSSSSSESDYEDEDEDDDEENEKNEDKEGGKNKKNLNLNNKIDKKKMKYVFFLLPPTINNNDPNNNAILKFKRKNVPKKYEESGKKYTKDKIENIKDLIELGKSYHFKTNLMYKNIKLEQVYNIVEPLIELDNMIGLKEIKIKIVNQILFFLQNFHKNIASHEQITFSKNPDSSEMLHTIITGPPGVGKTQFAKILGKIYSKLGILSNGTFHEVKRSDLIGKYLGHTAAKTQEMIDKCKGGVMFIDEAYSLGHKEGRDSFSKECLDVINQNLTENRDFLCIMAGYEKELERCVFSLNPGLKRRFTFRYNINNYTPLELIEIFKLKIKESNWELFLEGDDEKKLYKLFVEKKNSFPYFGGDVETLLLQCKISHSCSMPEEKYHKKITLKNIIDGFNQFIKYRQYSKNGNTINNSSINLYT